MAGLRLRRGWARLPGAVGMWLWADPLRKRSGSVSVWADPAALRAFVGRPDHLRIVRAHRGRGTMRATSWTTEPFDTSEPSDTTEPFDTAGTWAAALVLLGDPSPWPEDSTPGPRKEAGTP